VRLVCIGGLVIDESCILFVYVYLLLLIFVS